MSTYTIVVLTPDDDDDMAVISVDDDDDDGVEALVEGFREPLRVAGYRVELQENVYLSPGTLETIFKEYLANPILRPPPRVISSESPPQPPGAPIHPVQVSSTADAVDAANELVIAQAPPYVRDELRQLVARGLVLHADEAGWTAGNRLGDGNHLSLYLELGGYAHSGDGEHEREGVVDLHDPSELNSIAEWITKADRNGAR